MRTLGDYTLLEGLGPTELGTLHLAAAHSAHGARKTTCTLEILDPEVAEDPERIAATLLEVAAARRFAHSGVDPIFGAGRSVAEDGTERVWLARPAPSGWSLSSMLEYSGRVSELLLVQVSVWLTVRLAEIVDAAHRQGLLHGALAPESVRITPEAEVFLRDLGIGSLLGGSERRLAFRAPELVVSDVLTPRADVYGLGMILTTCLIGQCPFARSDPLSTRRAVLEHRFPRVRATRPALSPRMDELLARMCALDPLERPATAAEVAETLREILGPSESLVPAVFRRQLLRVPVERAFDPDVVKRTRARLAAETLTGEPPEPSEPERAQPRLRPRSGRGRVAGADPMAPSRARVDRFALDLQLASEGPIATFEAVDLESGDPVLLRVFESDPSSDLGRLPLEEWRVCYEQEAALAGSLAHPSVLGFRGSGEDDGLLWIAYTPPPRELLSERLIRDPHLDRAAVLLDLAKAVDHLHRRGVVASGLGSRAVRVSTRGLAVFADLSRVSPAGGRPHPRLEDDPFVLTPEFVAARRHDQSSDLFLLGVIAYEALTGTRPFRGLDAFTVMDALRNRSPRPPSSVDPRVDPELSALTMRLLARDPRERPSTAQAVIDALPRRRRN